MSFWYPIATYKQDLGERTLHMRGSTLIKRSNDPGMTLIHPLFFAFQKEFYKSSFLTIFMKIYYNVDYSIIIAC
jgi:hypothetical protein